MLGSIALRSSNVLRATRSVSGQVARVSMRSLSSLALSRSSLTANVERTKIGSTVFRAAWSRSLLTSPDSRRGNNPPNENIFVGNLPWSATQQEMDELFSEYGKVKRIRIHTHSDGRPRGFAHVEYESKESAVACFSSAAEEPLYFGGRDLVVDYAAGQKTQHSSPNNRLYFAGAKEGEDELRTLLGNHAENVVTIYFLKDGVTGDRLANGFVEFKDISAATEALEALDGAALPSGERLSASYARPQKPREERRPRNPRLYEGSREGYTGRGVSRRTNPSDRY